jgi:hypothetical protein
VSGQQAGQAAGPLYPKINTIWKRDPVTNRVMVGDFTQPEVGYLRDLQWHWYEKIDGTNIRLHFDGERVLIGGRKDSALIPTPLHDYLTESIDNVGLATWSGMFDGPVTIYGEGFGAGIQKGGGYGAEQRFIVFDVRIEDWWLDWENVTDIAEKLGYPTVPFLGTASIDRAVDIVVADEYESAWPDVQPEGLVGRPGVPLYTKRCDRIICKIKRVDYQHKGETK